MTDLDTLATEAYVYGFPLVFNLEQVVRYATTGVGGNPQAPFNSFSHARTLATALTTRNLPNLIVAVIEVSIMALPMTLIIIAGEIDLSVESMAGLAVAILGILSLNGVGLEIAIPIALVLGAIGGLLNGIFVTVFGLPSLVVTLG